MSRLAPGARDLTESLAAERLAPLLEPLARLIPGLTVAIEAPDGGVLAAAGQPGAADDQPAAPVVWSADVVHRASVVGRVRAGSAGVPEAPIGNAVGAAVESLAAALAALIDEVVRRAEAVAALDEAASAAGTEDRHVEAELALGRRIQRSLLPLRPPDVPGWELASHYEAATEVGGDFFDAFVIRGRGPRFALVVADVTGKGIAAALQMAFARPLLHAAIDHSPGPAVALERTNRVLVEERRAALFITAFCAIVDRRSGRVRVANAGHEPPLVVRAATGRLAWLAATGPLLGVFGRLDLREHELDLAPGDVLLLHTDGVTDARSPGGRRFGERRLRAVVRDHRGASAGELVAAIVAAVRRFEAGTPAADDLTLVAVRRLPVRRRDAR